MSNQTKEAIETAQTAIRHARELAKNESFQWLLGVLRTRADVMADDVLHRNALTPEEREALRRERLGILEAIRTASDQEEAQTRFLAGQGIRV